MKILLLTPQLPYPPRQGTTIRNDGLIRHLAQRHTVDLLTFVTPEQEPDHDSPLYHACRRIAYLPQPVRSARQRVIDTLRSPLPDMALRLESPAMHNLVQSWLADGYDIVQMAFTPSTSDGLGPTSLSSSLMITTANICCKSATP